MPLLTVIDAGTDTRLVDFGRPGLRSLGVGVGGAADRWALTLGNALVGNPPDAPALELCLRGPTLSVHRPILYVVCGAPFTLRSGQYQLWPNFCHLVNTDERLHIGGTPEGLRAYLCVAGGFAVRRILGSASGFEPIQRGIMLYGQGWSGVTDQRRPHLGLSAAMLEHIQPADTPVTLRVLPGDHASAFVGGLAALLHSEYTVTAASDRMGLRLTGPVLRHGLAELLSEPVVPGTVQVTHDGQPVILGVDAQTIGGYPRLAHVVTADWDRLAQVRPGQRVRFAAVDQPQARHLLRERASRLADYCDTIRLFRQG